MVSQLFIDQVMNGLADGVVYAGLALSLVIIYRTTGLLNFAQGEMALFSTFVCWQFTEWGLGIWSALLVTMVLSFAGGALLERVIIRPVEKSHSQLNVVIVTLGLLLAFNALSGLLFIKPGREALKMPLLFGDELFGVRVNTLERATLGRLLILVIECVLLYLLLQRTKVGLSLRAVASNPESARLVGVNPGRMLMLGWGLAAAIGAVAGVLAVSKGTGGFDTGTMQQVLIFAFAAAALGGFDSMIGAVVGGMIVGVLKSLTIQYIDALEGIELVVPFGLIVVVLIVRPNGLFGRSVVERV